jgi:large subunit ribosomal protein L21
MFAVVSTGGKQYRVEPGTTLAIERLAVEPGATVTFDRVLLVADGDETTIGTPTVAGATVSGTVLGDERGPKIVIFKFKQKIKYRRHAGHRQQLTRVRIDEIAREGASRKASTTQEPVKESEPAAEEAAKPRRTRAAAAAKAASATAASAKEAEAEKPAPKRTATRRATSRRKAESEE